MEEKPGWMAPLGLFLLALAVFWAALWLQSGAPFPQSRWPYFVYYAGALLDARLDLVVLPPERLDLAVFEGRVYLPFPPFPALLFVPWVAACGLDAPDRFFCVLVAALNGPLCYAVLSAVDRRGLAPVPVPARILLCAFFLFGTPYLHLAIVGNMWGFAHVVCNTLLLATLWAILCGRALLATLAFVGVLFTRSHVVLAAPALIGLYWILDERGGEDLPARLRRLLPAAAVLLGGAALLLAFNYARFGDPFESGLAYHQMHPMFRARFDAHGAFDLAYLPRNLGVLLLGMPVASAGFPWLTFSPTGLSLFIASPLYVYLFASLRSPHRRLGALLWLGVGLPAIPILLFMGTGEVQFGYRYATDVQIFLLLLTYLGMGARWTRTASWLLFASILMNTYGTWWFARHFAS